ncbi:MAG: hypothetical protein V3U10_01765, partial [Bacteroidota bacterium]
SLVDPEGEIPPYKKLFRKVNSNSPELIGNGIVDFRLQYFNAVGKPLTGFSPTESTTLDSIRSVRIQVKLQSIILADTIYGGTYWEKYISPKNL